MQAPSTKMLRIGEWCVDPATGQISRLDQSVRLEGRAMRLLLCLADHRGETVSIEDLLNQVWPDVIVTPDSVYQAVASLRRLLGDDPRQPAYIATVPRLGYRMIARVEPAKVELPGLDPAQDERWPDGKGGNGRSPAAVAPADPWRRSSQRLFWTVASGLIVVLGIGLTALLAHRRTAADPPAIASPPADSIAVLPFLDLTEGMKNEEFADGMTEELIDKLSHIQGLRVSSATASLYFKGRSIPVAEIARQLDVAWVLDGSVRKSQGWIRVDVRLTRADQGYIAWSQTYDQPEKNILAVQDEIATAAAAALRSPLKAGAKPDKRGSESK